MKEMKTTKERMIPAAGGMVRPVAIEDMQRGEGICKASFFLASVEADRRIYAYETDKQYLLNLLGAEAKRAGFEVVAFVVLDQEYHVILVRRGETQKPSCEVLQSIEQNYQCYYRSHSGITGEVKQQIAWQRVGDRELLPLCSRLHELPVRRGYVSEASDFWWSSQNHYKGRYEWHFLNVWWVFALQAVMG